MVLNQNFIKGWKVKKGEAKNIDGLVGTDAEKGWEVVFYYLPNSFILGALITIASMIFSIFFLYKFKNNFGKIQ